MRTSSLVTISVPPLMLKESEKVARRKHMTRSELMRTALRQYLEWQMAEEAIRVADEELENGMAKILPSGGLVKLMKQGNGSN